MYTIPDLILSGVGITLLGACTGLVLGLPGAWRWGRNAFFSLGMSMFFLGWLQFINFDGSWPADQPPDKGIAGKRTKAEAAKLEAFLASIDPMTTQDWDDYHRCKGLNVCVRRFQGQRTGSSPTAPPAPQPTIETRCVVMDGVLRCNEYIRR
jgi:hypothetical protein